MYNRSTTDVLVPVGIISIVLLLVVPVPSWILDFLLASNICISLLVLLVVVYVPNPSEFSVLPTILLTTTLARLSLNIASTRLILIDGFAGNIIYSFGSFVVQGNLVVGAIIFVILVLINFLVITKGSGRIAEVAARFTLDALPGKQMAIDAELNAGAISEVEAKQRRAKVQGEIDFYGAMDGASKFVRGDAVAGIVITLINVLGGISIGMLQKGFGISEALQTYVLMSIGDGLVSQIPALLISVAAGIIITRENSEDSLGKNLASQLLIRKEAFWVLSGICVCFAMLPGMPKIAFFGLATVSYFIGRSIGRRAGSPSDKREASNLADGSQQTVTPTETAAASSDSPAVEKIAFELGYGLVGLADVKRGGDLLDRVAGIRRTLGNELGIEIGPISVRDNLELDPNQYRVLVFGRKVAGGSIMVNRWLAMNVSGCDVSLKGVPTVEPVFGIEAFWISEEERKTAEMNDFTVVDSASVLITHLSETIKDNLHEIIDREDIQRLIESVREHSATAVNEILPDVLTVGIIQQVIRNLLRERVPVRNRVVVFEALADYAQYTKNPDELSEQVRRRLGKYFVPDFYDGQGRLIALTLDPALEAALIASIKRSPLEVRLMIEPDQAQAIISELSQRVDEMAIDGLAPLVITSAEIRLAFQRFFGASLRNLTVLAYQEIPEDAKVQNFGFIRRPEGMSASIGESALPAPAGV